MTANDIAILENRLPPEIRETLTPEQKRRIAQAFRDAKWGKTPVYANVSVAFLGRRFFLTIAAGKERRSVERLRRERAAHPLLTTGNVLFFLCFAWISLSLGVGAAMLFSGHILPHLADLPFATIYLFAFAFTATAILGLILYGMEKRRRQDGTAYNFALIKLNSTVASVLWLLSIVPYWTDGL